MDQSKFKEQTKNELNDALVYFIDQQKLVAQAMLDLGLDLELVGQFGAFAWVSGTWTLDDKTKSWLKQLDKLFAGDEYAPGEEALIEAIKRNAERQFPQRGIWDEDGEWEYFLQWPDRKNNLKHLQLWIDTYGKTSIDALIDEMKSEGIIENHQIIEGLKNILKDR